MGQREKGLLGVVVCLRFSRLVVRSFLAPPQMVGAEAGSCSTVAMATGLFLSPS